MNSIPAFVIFHVPHDSTVIPASVRQQFLLGDAALATEIVRMTDHQTLKLFARDVPSNQIVYAEVSRIVVDCERFLNDFLEPMSALGMGAVYQRTSDGLNLRRPITPIERQALIDTWYHPHHKRLESMTQQFLDQYDRALLIDAHSFPSRPLLYELDQSADRPEICIGTDEFHTPKLLAAAFVDAFSAAGFDVRLDVPFAGALVPLRHYRTDRRVSAIMVEVNRGTHLDESSGESNAEFTKVANKIRRCICEAIKSWESSAQTSR